MKDQEAGSLITTTEVFIASETVSPGRPQCSRSHSDNHKIQIPKSIFFKIKSSSRSQSKSQLKEEMKAILNGSSQVLPSQGKEWTSSLIQSPQAYQQGQT